MRSWRTYKITRNTTRKNKFMNFEELIISQIGCPTTVKYGYIGPEYLVVLAFIDGKFVELGELLYRIRREKLATERDIIAFGKECEKFRIGNVKMHQCGAINMIN